MRILGLDVGSVRTGVALSDELFLTAQGRTSIPHKDVSTDIEAIKKIILEENVGEVVVGLPLSMNGSHSQQTRTVLEFVATLTAAVNVPVRTWDERLTSKQAERTLLEADMSRSKRRQLSDKLAAQFILQSYLDARKRT